MRRALIVIATFVAVMIACTAMAFASTDINDNWMIIVDPTAAYTGSEVCPEVTVVQKEDYLIYNEWDGERYDYADIYVNYMERGADNWDLLLPSAYTVEYIDNINTGMATVTVTPTADSGLSGQLTQDFQIYSVKAPVTKKTNSDYSVTVNVNGLEDALESVTCDGRDLIEGTDYGVLSNGNVILYYSFLSGTSRMDKNFNKHDIQLIFRNHYATLSVKGYNIKTYYYYSPYELVYTGKTLSPVRVYDLTKGTQYKVVYSSSKRAAIGKHTYKIKGIAPYTGTISSFYTVIPKKPSFGTVKRATSYVKVNWKKVANCSGYQIKLIKESPDYGETDDEDAVITTTYKTVTVANKATTYKKITASKKKYNVIKIRAYKTVKGKKYYSYYSTKKY